MYPIVAIEDSRKIFDKLNNYYGVKFGINPEFSQIRIEEVLVNGQGVYNFDVKKERPGVTEQSLRRNDLFVAINMGFYFMMENAAKPGVSYLLPYAQQGEEAGETSVYKPGFATDDIQALYNGKLYCQTGTIVNIEDMPMSVFQKVPEYQAGATTVIDMMKSQITMAEKLAFAGTQDHVVKVSFPSFTTSNYASATTGEVAKLVFIAYGYKVPGGTGDKFRTDENPFRALI